MYQLPAYSTVGEIRVVDRLHGLIRFTYLSLHVLLGALGRTIILNKDAKQCSL